MTGSLVFYGILGVITTIAAFGLNRRLFVGDRVGGVGVLEGLRQFHDPRLDIRGREALVRLLVPSDRERFSFKCVHRNRSPFRLLD